MLAEEPLASETTTATVDQIMVALPDPYQSLQGSWQIQQDKTVDRKAAHGSCKKTLNLVSLSRGDRAGELR